MKKAFLYVRVSTEEQRKHGLSVDAQINALQDYCKANNIEVYDIYNDAGISAHIHYTKRKELLRLIDDAQAGKADLILFTKLDRWFRSIEDYYAVMAQIPETVPWQAIWEDYETVTSSGKFKVNIMLSIAQAEAERTSERIRSTFEYKRAKGDYVGSAPFGYKRENNKLVKDPDESKYVEIVFETYLKTHSATKAMRAAREAGSSITRNGVFFMLRNETYAGNACGTKCEGYITPEQFARIQEIKESNFRSPRYDDRFYMFARLCTCGICGKKLRAITNRQFSTPYIQYSCDGNHLIDHNGFSISERKIEKHLLENLDEIIAAHNLEVESIAEQDQQADEIEKKRIKLQNQLERIGIRFELGDITIDEYKQKRLDVQREIANLPVCNSSAEIIELPSNWKEVYSQLDAEHRQQFWFSIIKDIEIDQQKNIKIKFN